jgi:hypothetical protein
MLLWGLVPLWAKDASIGARLINARSETVEEKPSFRDAFRRRRCLIPSDGADYVPDPAGVLHEVAGLCHLTPGEVSEELADLLLAHLRRVALLMEEDVPPDPV